MEDEEKYIQEGQPHGYKDKWVMGLSSSASLFSFSPGCPLQVLAPFCHSDEGGISIKNGAPGFPLPFCSLSAAVHIRSEINTPSAVDAELVEAHDGGYPIPQPFLIFEIHKL